MSHWAEIDNDNIVTRVLVTDNNDPVGDEGFSWLIENLGGTWIKTSYNGNIRKNFAGVGHLYDPVLDAFIAPQPFPSWYLNEETCQWEAPVDYPTDGLIYNWDEDSLDWSPAHYSTPSIPEGGTQ